MFLQGYVTAVGLRIQGEGEPGRLRGATRRPVCRIFVRRASLYSRHLHSPHLPMSRFPCDGPDEALIYIDSSFGASV